MSPAPGRLRRLVREVVRALRGHDVALYAAGLTFYGALALVPLLVLALAAGGLVLGEGALESLAVGVLEALPAALLRDAAVDDLVRGAAGAGLGTLLPALALSTLYGEGLVRALSRLDAQESRHRGLRGRVRAVLLVAAVVVLVVVGLAAASGLLGAAGGNGAGPALLRVYLAFVVGWAGATALLLLVYRAFPPTCLPWRASLWGAAAAGSFLSGGAQGLLLVLRLGDDRLGAPFAGAAAVGVGVVVVFFLWLAHLVLLVGWVLAAQVAARDGRVLGPPVRPAPLRAAA